jgi:hypothetical protein
VESVTPHENLVLVPGPQAGGHLLPGADQSPGSQPGADLDGADFVGWLNCECFFSLVLVGLLAALPFNLHCNGKGRL